MKDGRLSIFYHLSSIIYSGGKQVSESILQEKSYEFALRIVKLSQYLNNEKREFVLSRKVLDSGTSMGVLIEEARQRENRSDFIQRLSVANKEAFKTNYWLRLLRDGEQISEKQAGFFTRRLRRAAENADLFA